MIFTMYKKETADKKHHTNPYRAVNYIRDENGNPICPNGRKFLFKRKQHVRYKKYVSYTHHRAHETLRHIV